MTSTKWGWVWYVWSQLIFTKPHDTTSIMPSLQMVILRLRKSTFIRMFISSFNRQVFIAHLQCSRHSPGRWGKYGWILKIWPLLSWSILWDDSHVTESPISITSKQGITNTLSVNEKKHRTCRFHLAWKWRSLSCVQLFVTPWTIQSMEFSRPEYWNG